MKNIVILLTIGLSSILGVNAQSTWEIEPSHAKIGFAIAHFGISETEGKFHQYKGTVVTSKEDFSDAQIELAIAVSSIDTENEQRDTHLKGEDFFEVEKYPEITFKSKELKALGNNKYKLIGEFNMHGVVKTIELDAEYRGTVKDPWGNTKAGFLVTGELNREDYGLTWNTVLEAGGLAVGKEVELECNLELIKKS
ncbi:MAG: YceI family protein [Bacteroidota bacterium]